MPQGLTGTLGPDGRPTITVRIEGRREPLACILDTGFNGKLWVPGDLAEDPGFEPVGSEYISLADGSIVVAGIATATIDWFDQPEAITVIVGGTGEPLLGTGMLAGCRLHVDFVDRTVRVERVARGSR